MMTTALPIDPTERDYESFRDACKLRGLAFEHDRFGNGKHKNPWTQQAFCVWWSVERERQLLQNLNQSQGAEISRLMSKIKKLEEA